jgi:large subunit ribosomal protein L21e
MSGKKAKGKRSKTRCLFKRSIREKTTISQILKPINIGDVVQININSSKHDGLPHKRMQGKTGKVISFQGKSPIVELYDGNLKKKIIATPVHLKKIKQIEKVAK